MANFVDELRQAKGQGSMPTFYGAGDTSNMQEDLNQIMPLRREMLRAGTEDYKERARFDNELQYNNQIRMRSMLDPSAMASGPTGFQNQGGQPMETVLGKDPGASGGLTAKDQAGLSLDRAKLGLDERKLQAGIQSDKDTLALNRDKLALDATQGEMGYKAKMIESERKVADSERKSGEAQERLKLAYDQLQERATNAQAQQAYNEARIAAQQASHQLAQDKAAHDAELSNARIAELEERIRSSKDPKIVKTEVSDDGTEKKVTTTSGAEPLTKTQRNSKGETRVVMSTDGGKTWQPKK